MLNEALRWWVARLGELAPSQFTWQRTVSPNALVIAASEGAGASAMAFKRRNGQEMPLGAFIPGVNGRHAPHASLNEHGGERMVLLRPPSSALLERQLVLPLIAERELRRVVGYEMNWQTPFEADEVFWTCMVVQRDRTRGRLHVRLSLVPKAPLLPLLDALERAGMPPSALEARPPGRPPFLIPVQQALEQTGWRRRATIFMAGACGVLALAAVALPLVRQSLALGQVTDRIAAVRPAVAQVQSLRQRIAAAGAGRDAIADEQLKAGNALEVLAAITDLLPNDTFLTDLVLRQRQLTITGQSAAASKLIAGLAADPRFRNPAFAAPVTRDDAARSDVFSIHTDVGP